MVQYQITCVIHDSNGVILYVGVKGVPRAVSEVVREIDNGINTFYTKRRGTPVLVYTKRLHSGRKFLTTNPDSILENNLDFLPEC